VDLIDLTLDTDDEDEIQVTRSLAPNDVDPKPPAHGKIPARVLEMLTNFLPSFQTGDKIVPVLHRRAADKGLEPSHCRKTHICLQKSRVGLRVLLFPD
jgi:hypothetical protein